MKLLIFHGYMLRGTGSNIYNANLASALARLGHEVHLVCQDRRVRLGGVEIHNPDIGGLLPVYVKDPYEGFEVKAFPELTEDELRRYLDKNVAALRALSDRVGGFDVAFANHLVMGPAILARADVAPFAAKVHGSALEYTVKPGLDRFGPHAAEGMAAASCVLVGSRHTAESLWETLPDVPNLREKTRLGPPGVDTVLFRPRDAGPRAAADIGGSRTGQLAAPPDGRRQDPRPGDLVAFVGKLIVAKGVDLLIAAWPLVRARHPQAVLRLAGYGEYERGLRGLLAALDAGDLDRAREIARAGRALEGGEEGPLTILGSFLAEPPPGYLEAARGVAASVEFAGRLEHDEVAALLPRAEALVMPSTFPEAFGMVAVEAAACGALPVSADHSGMREVSARLAEALPGGARELVSFPVAEGAVGEIADRVGAWLSLPEAEREAAREALVETARRLWSWEGVARGAISAARGELDRLPLA